MSQTDDPRAEDLLPLPSATFHILVALAESDRHGYAIIQDIRARTEGEVSLTASTLYAAIKRLLDVGLIEELEEGQRPDDDDERRRYYRILPAGLAVARLEATRLIRAVRMARQKRLAPRNA